MYEDRLRLAKGSSGSSFRWFGWLVGVDCLLFFLLLAVALSAPNAEELCIRGAANDMVLQGVMQAPLETDLHTKGMLGMACNDLSVSESGEKNTNHFQTNPFRRPLGCNFASFPFSGVGLFFSLAFCHFPSPLGQTYVS